ncbi:MULTISPECIES: MauE/DoxX family redox-associated membrane protein [unclassified Pseudomonas]|uniref:MauE/DoxX family redox-associated membrane protein n=1 Tax=unclassified Pseudomonas TaxID=196821 RepID=UPI000C87F4D1|nr:MULTISPECIES: MauE/DoxX family redox-associated membrane protein [unclassified Pseudomonas]PMZ73237.1 hypothetical protein C1X25_08850 [Pseudomonas sp. GW247-3R2A]PMY73367.1 hypothetical protein C1X26_11845 [Pseudomonas sp. MPR-R3A]PMY98047.1 hypothetical protein C1X24_11125 [Pseudomonas sp. FW305-124]PNA92635.1 hypothetical protein C1X23_13635 [Pseudomonas sp. FW300-E2]PNB03187.1 hypothetical protein C1X27_09305 [Pseudomonas sp. MPR-AND1B]
MVISVYLHDPLVHLASAGGLALLLSAAGLHKLQRPQGFAVVLNGYGAELGSLLPTRLRTWLSGLLPVLELLAAAGLLASLWQPWAACPALCLLAFYTLVLAIVALRGSSIADCGCHFGDRPQPPGWSLVLRNLLMLLPALNLVSPMIERPLLWFDGITLTFATAGGVVLYQLAHLLISNRASLRNL